MAYSALPSKSASDTLTLTNYDNVRDNFAAGVPDLYTTKGDIAPATGADAAARLAVGADDAVLVANSACNVGMAWYIPPGARVRNASTLGITVSTWTGLTFDTEAYDFSGMHTTTGSTGRLTVPQNGEGVYLIGGNVQFTALDATSACYAVRITRNGTTQIAEQFLVFSVNNPVELNIHTVDRVAASGDYLTMEVYCSKSCSIAALGNVSPEFWCQWLRKP